MEKNDIKERRVQYMLPCELHEEMKKTPLIYLPLAPLEWHGPHLVMGADPINAEKTALAVADKTGGVVFPTLYMGTERERQPKILESLGFDKDEYIVGMDFPKAKGLFKSFYFTEELFAMVVREHIEQCIEHGYKYIFIVNGHGAVNHNEVLKRLCTEFSNEYKGIKVAYSISFDDKSLAAGLCSHAGIDETSLMMFYDESFANIGKLPAKNEKLKYTDYSIVDSGGFEGKPGEGHTVPSNMDPRRANAKIGKNTFRKIVDDVCRKVKRAFSI
ncbi:MAG: hypothetical protein A2020_08110 [Lentisphaerae bacterium GWF2_45_14]|nr:MAG: hypothetical protein A2020_08110 [Lentisphaerae bacterium GWF2_45_14]